MLVKVSFMCMLMIAWSIKKRPICKTQKQNRSTTFKFKRENLIHASSLYQVVYATFHDKVTSKLGLGINVYLIFSYNISSTSITFVHAYQKEVYHLSFCHFNVTYNLMVLLCVCFLSCICIPSLLGSSSNALLCVFILTQNQHTCHVSVYVCVQP